MNVNFVKYFEGHCDGPKVSKQPVTPRFSVVVCLSFHVTVFVFKQCYNQC